MLLFGFSSKACRTNDYSPPKVKGKSKPSRQFEYPEPEVKLIRKKTGLSQTRFAALIGVSKRTLENWEQGRRNPTGPARSLLRLVDTDPDYMIKALHN